MRVNEIQKGCQYIKDLRKAKSTVKDSANLHINIATLPNTVVTEIQEEMTRVIDEKIVEVEHQIKNLVNNEEV